MTKEVTKMKQMNQKTKKKGRWTIRRSWRKMGRCRTVTLSTTTTTARQSESKQVWGRRNARRTRIPQQESKRERWKERARRREGASHSLKPRTADILRKSDSYFCTTTQKTLSHMFICTCRRHRDPADDIHYINWQGFCALSSEKNASLSVWDVSTKTSKRTGEKQERSKVRRGHGRGLMLLLLKLSCSNCVP